MAAARTALCARTGHIQVATGAGAARSFAHCSACRIPALDDIPREFNVHLMKDTPNANAVHSSRGIGEPPILLSGSVLFALRDAVRAARAEGGVEQLAMPYDAPLTSERLRMACLDSYAQQAILATDKAAVPLDFRTSTSF